MVKVGNEFLAVYTKDDVVIQTICEPCILNLEATPYTGGSIFDADFIGSNMGYKEYTISKVEDLLEGVLLVHYRSHKWIRYR